jgi:hypothetical protein
MLFAGLLWGIFRESPGILLIAHSGSGELFSSLFYSLYLIICKVSNHTIKAAVVIAKRGRYEKQKNRASAVY